MHHPSLHARAAFSLVELSIVLVILGLLTGGILSGQSLIRASEMRAVVSEYQRYSTAVQSFRDKYQALPGDMPNAHSFWGYEGGSLTDASNCSATYALTTARSGTCDGNGDGRLNTGTAIKSTAESFQFWKQMALAGLIEGSYTGYSGPTDAGAPWTGNDGVLGQNVPKSKASNTGWGALNLNSAGDTATYKNNYNNMFVVGAPVAGNYPSGGSFNPQEAWNVDTKLDDGKPGTGKIWVYGWTNCTTGTASASDYTGTYNLSSTTKNCGLWFPSAF